MLQVKMMLNAPKAPVFPQRLPRDVIEQMLADALKMSVAHSFVNQVVLEAERQREG